MANAIVEKAKENDSISPLLAREFGGIRAGRANANLDHQRCWAAGDKNTSEPNRFYHNS